MKIHHSYIPMVLLLVVLLAGCGRKGEGRGRSTESKIDAEAKEAARGVGEALDKASDSLNRGLRSLQDGASGKK
ncbi:MAG: hypothetical protein HQ559_11145 [Lentisphaerae bacterium]|nr:hypothetical protein [Lentisphaerota bacterium]